MKNETSNINGLEIFQALSVSDGITSRRLLPIFLQPSVDNGDGLIDGS